MNCHWTTAILAATTLLSGCAFEDKPVVVESVGPPAFPSANGGPKGVLMVYSAYDPDTEFSDVPLLREYTDFKILSEDGKPLQTVRNNDGSVVERPVRVELPAGRYRIMGRAKGYKRVTVPVVILADQLTEIHLEGGAAWPHNAALLQSDPVRLPNGEIVGWRANKAIGSKP